MRKITRNMKKSLSLVLAMLMVFSVSSSNPPVHAEEPSTAETTEIDVEDGKEEGKEDTVKVDFDVEPSSSQYMEFHIQNDTGEEIVVSVDKEENLTLGKGEIRPFYMDYQNGQRGTICVSANGKEYVLNKEDFFATGTVMVKKSAEGTLFFDYGTSETAEEIRFDHDYSSVSDMDFSTKQLLVGTGNKEVFTKNTNVVSEYEGLYLLQFNTVEETRSAYSYYVDKVDFIIADTKDFAVSDGEEAASNESKEKDALTELKEALEETSDMRGTIALIDTGAKGPNVVAAFSVLGEETEDDNGHGTKMLDTILGINPNAKIVSIKALGKDGKGKISDIYAAIRLATERHVSIINLSACALATTENEIICEAIEDAIREGIVVVGAAGNRGMNAKYFIPAKVEDAIIVGSANKDGEKNADSNYGGMVDYYVEAESTSVAAAKISAILSKYGNVTKSEKEAKIYVNLYDADGAVPELTEIDFMVADTKTTPATNHWIMSLFSNESFSTTVNGTTYTDSNPQAYITYDKRPAICLLHDAANPADWDRDDPAVGGYLDVEVSNITDQKLLNIIFWLSASTEDGGLGCMIQNPANPSRVDYINEYCMSSVLRTYYRYYVPGDVLETYDGNKRSYAYFNEELPTTVPYVDHKGTSHELNIASFISQYQNKAISSQYLMTAQYLKTGVTLNTAPNASGKYAERYQDFLSWSVIKPKNAVFIYKVEKKVAADGTVSYEPVKDVTFRVQRRGANGNTPASGTFTVTTDANGIAVFAGGYGNGIGFDERDWYAQEVLSAVNTEMSFDPNKWTLMKSQYDITKKNYDISYKSGWDATTYPNISAGLNSTSEKYAALSKILVSKGGRNLTSPSSYAVVNTKKDAKYIYKIDANGKGIPGVIFEVKQDNSDSVFRIVTDENGLAVWAGTGAYGGAWGERIDGINGVFSSLGSGLDINEPGWRARELKCSANAMYYVDDTVWYPMGSLSKKTGHYYSYYLNRWNQVKQPDSTEAAKTTYLNTQFDAAILTATNAKNGIVGEDVYGNGVIQNGEAYVTLVKKSAVPEYTDANPNYVLAGTTYKIYQTRALAESAQTSKDYSKAIGTLVCKGDGTTNGVNLKNYMKKNASTREFQDTTFYVVESVAGKGFKLDSAVYPVVVKKANQKNNPAVLNVKDTPGLDPIPIEITKKDIGGNSPEGKEISLEGAQFTIQYYAVDTSKEETAETLKKLTPTAKWTIQTKKIPETGAYVAALNTAWLVGNDNSPFYYVPGDTKNPAIPYGYVTIEETSAPKGYTVTGSKVTAGGVTVSGNVVVGKIIDQSKKMYLSIGNPVSGEIVVAESPVRPNFSLVKKDENGKAMAGVSFQITNTTTKESFTFVTGNDGSFTSKGQTDVWFRKNEDGTMVDKNAALKERSDLGALMVGFTYEVKEIRTGVNKGYQLEPAITFTVPTNAKSTDNFAVKYVGDVVTNVAMPKIGTTATVMSTSSKVLPQNAKAERITDQIQYTNLKADTDFILEGKLMVVDADGTYRAYEKDGKEYVVTKQFKTGAAYSKSIYEVDGTVSMDFEIDTTKLDGKKLVVFEKLYLGTVVPKTEGEIRQYEVGENIFPVVHEDIDSVTQTVVVSSGSTTAMDQATGDHVATVAEGANVSLVDTIHIKNLPAGTYEMQGRLMDKVTGKELETEGKQVTAAFSVAKDGSVTSKNQVLNVKYDTTLQTVEFDLKMPFTISSKALSGKDVVVFEKCLMEKSDKTYFEIWKHESIQDLGQTLHFTDVKTIATDRTYKGHIGTVSEEAILIEKSMLSNLTYGMEYEVVASLIDQMTGKPIMADKTEVKKTAVVSVGKDGTVTALEKESKTALTVSVTRNSKELGTVDVSVDIPILYNSSSQSGKRTVVYEDLFHNGVKIKSHADKNDTSETVNYYQLTLTKTGLDNPKAATFVVKDKKDQTLMFVKVKDGVFNLTTAKNGVSEVNPDEKGTLILRGFNDETYTFTEKKTEGNHSLLADSFQITFTKRSETDGTLKQATASVGTKTITLAKDSDELPNAVSVEVLNTDVVSLHTGGNGTGSFLLVSFLLFMLGIVILVRKKKMVLLLLMASGVLMVPLGAYAKEQMPTIDDTQETTLTVQYDDDMDGKSPVKGAEFTVYKVADLSPEGGYVSLVKSLDYSEVVAKEKELVSLEAVEAVKKEMKEVARITTDDTGRATAKLDVGLFLVVESKPAPYHFASVPFLITLPRVATGEDGKPLYNKDGERYWEYEATAHPKASTAGNILVQKFVKGSAGEKEKEFHFTITFSYEGELRYTMNSGKEGILKSGDTLPLKDGEQLLIEMVPSGVSFEVTEVEANQNGYTTTVRGNKGRVKRFETSAVYFENYKDTTPKTGDGFKAYILVLCIGSLASIGGILFLKRKNREGL